MKRIARIAAISTFSPCSCKEPRPNEKGCWMEHSLWSMPPNITLYTPHHRSTNRRRKQVPVEPPRKHPSMGRSCGPRGPALALSRPMAPATTTNVAILLGSDSAKERTTRRTNRVQNPLVDRSTRDRSFLESITRDGAVRFVAHRSLRSPSHDFSTRSLFWSL